MSCELTCSPRREPPTTNSVNTVQVCGTATTACSGAASIAAQAWQWNLDYVLDPHGNAEVLYYNKFVNYYEELGNAAAVPYVRDSQLSEIDYGLRSGSFSSIPASDKVLFTYAPRCEIGVAGEPAGACSTQPPSSGNAAYWPDVPWDQYCGGGTCTQTSPTFWSQSLLSTVTTQVLSGGAYTNVDTWTLSQIWPDPGDGSSASLWLSSVAHTGYSSGSGTNGPSAVSTPLTGFAGTRFQNRVAATGGLVALNKYRLTGIDPDTGAIVTVTYYPQDCSAGSLPPSPEANIRRCFPTWWAPAGSSPQPDWFNKYLVAKVVSAPATGGSSDANHETDYFYTDPGQSLWRFDESPAVTDSQRTWDTFTGYKQVEIRTGDPAVAATQHTTDYTFFQGLNGDPDGPINAPTSASRSATLSAGSVSVPDNLPWAGQVFEQITRVGSSGTTAPSTTPILADTVTAPSNAVVTATSSYNYTAYEFGNSTAWSAGAFYGTYATLTADVNHDGKADLIAVDASNTFVMLSTGSGYAAPSTWSSVPFHGTVGTYAADVNHDGYADLVAVNSSSTSVMLASSGGGFYAPVGWSSVPFYGTQATLLTDVNGDGYADLVAVNASNTYVMLSSGTGFYAPVVWSSAAFYGTTVTLAGDINHDGKSDLIAVNGGSVYVMLANAGGTAFNAVALWSAATFSGTVATLVGDVNGDGYADLIAVDPYATRVMYSTGTGFLPQTGMSAVAFYGYYATLAGDATGDGKADLIAVDASNTYVLASTAGTVTQTVYLTGKTVATTTTPVSTGGTRTETITTIRDTTYGLTTQVEDATSDAGTTCTNTSYATASSSYLVDYPARVTKLGVACAATPTYPADLTVSGADVISDTATLYDGGALGAAPSVGDPTTSETAIGYSGSTPIWRVLSTATYDALGRALTSTDPNANGGVAATTSTSYTPATSGPLTSTTVTTTSPYSWTSTTTVNPAWGAVISSSDVNGNLTSATVDALGRTSQVWEPNWPQSAHAGTPSLLYSYSLSLTAANVVETTALNASGATTSSFALYDGLLQPIQTQAPSEGGGTVLTDTVYDANGQTVLTTAPYYATGTPSGTLQTPTGTLPSLTTTSYDGAGRTTASTLLAGATESPTAPGGTTQWTTTTAYSGADRTDVVPPSGGTPTSTFTNTRGKTTTLTQYLSTGISGTTESTTYGYDQRGDMTTMTNPAGSTWTWTFNVLAQQIQAVDPATGSSTTAYTADGQVDHTTDNAGNTLAYSYDKLGRKTGEYSGTTGGVELAAWTYDSATLGKNQPAAATRYIGGTAGSPGTGTAYASAVSAYTTLGSPASTTTTIGGTTPLAGSYTTGYTYAPDGSPLTQADPAEGGIAAETITDTYDTLGNPYSATSGLGSILDSATYTHLGQLAQTLATTSGTQIAHTYTYEPASLRLSTDYTNSPSSGGVLSNDTYTYDSAGDILEDNNVVTGVATDTQCYSYDPLQDLTAAWTPSSNACTAAPSSSALGGPAPYWTSYTINPANGDRTQDIRHATTGTGLDTRDTYTYPTSGYLAGGVGGPTAQSGVQHATAAAGTNPVTGTWTVTGADAYAYNGNGSTTTRPGQSITYDAEGHQQQVTVTAGTTQNDIYDANGTLLLQTESSAGTGTTAFLGDTELHVASGSSTVTATRTYTAAGQVLAERDTTSGVTGTQYYYLDTNTTGTAAASLAVSGATITRRYTDPYGNPRGTTTPWTSTHGYLNAPTSTLTGLDPPRRPPIRPHHRQILVGRSARDHRQPTADERLRLRRQRPGHQLRPDRPRDCL